MRRGAVIAWLGVLSCAAPLGAQTGGRLLVMPFENVTREARIFWLGEASSVLLADGLNALGANAMSREERIAAFEQLRLPLSAALSDAMVFRVGQLVGASHVVTGTLTLSGDTLVVRARSINLEAGRIAQDVSEQGPLSDLSGTLERLAARLAPAAASAPKPARAGPPLAAFEQYVKGLLARTPATAIAYQTAALKIAPDFARARLALWDIHAAQGEHERALAALKGIPSDSPWSRRARFRAGLSQIQLNRYDEAFATFRGLADERPDAAVMNNLGVVQMRRGGTPEAGLPSYYFNKAADADPTEPDYFFNLGYAYWSARDPRAAIYWLREGVRRDPADGDAHFVLGAALSAIGSAAEANRERELARRLSSTYEEWEKRPGEGVPKGLERLKGDVELPRAAGTSGVVESGQRDQRDLARFYLERALRLYGQERDTEALAELNRAVFLSPYDAAAHLLVGRIHLRGGRAHDAIDALKISLWSADSAEAHAVLAQAYLDAKDAAGARAEAERALKLDPSSTEARRVLEKANP